MSKLRIAGIISESVVDGPGVRYTIFTQGCPHNCEGCHNPQTHDFEGGYFADTDDLFDEMMADPLIRGVTLSGGEPFEQPRPLAELAARVHAAGKDVIAYSGYTYEELLDKSHEEPAIMDLLLNTDTLIDGQFVREQMDLELKFRGSANQRVIDVKRSLEKGQAVTFEFE